MHQFRVRGQPCNISYNAIGEEFQLKVQGKEFNRVYEDIKKKSAFNWATADKKHDAFKLNEFGTNIDIITKPTSREDGMVNIDSSPLDVERDEEEAKRRREERKKQQKRQQ